VQVEERQLDEFHDVNFEGVGELILQVGDRRPFEVSADGNLLPLIETSVKDGLLTIRFSQPVQPRSPLRFRAGTKKLDHVSAAGAASMTIIGVHGAKFALELSGAGSVDLAGEVGELDVVLSGAGNVDAQRLRARLAHAVVSGTGNVDLFVIDQLTAEISGAGSIYYIGEPRVESNITGVGKVGRKR